MDNEAGYTQLYALFTVLESSLGKLVDVLKVLFLQLNVCSRKGLDDQLIHCCSCYLDEIMFQ